jgi:hypothetical protein
VLSTANVVLPGLVGQVAGVLRRNLLVAVLPAAFLGAGADALYLFRHEFGAQLALSLLLALAFELYVGYAELIVAADRLGVPAPRIGALLRRALPFTPALFIASVIGVSLPLAATGLLVIPGIWLLTRWSVFAPAIVHEGVGPLEALSRSSALVRGAFWSVALAASGSVIVEHAVLHATALTDDPLGSLPVDLSVAAIAAMIVSPPAAFTISIVFERLELIHS